MGILGSFFGDAKQETVSTSQSTTLDASFSTRDVDTLSTATLSGTRNTSLGAGTTNSQVESSGTNNIITTTDFGAVSQSLQLAFKGVEAANKLGTTALEQSASMTAGIFDAQAAQTKQLAGALESIKTTDKQALVAGVLVILAVVAGYVYRKGA